MPVTNAYCSATKYRITLELDVLDDFNPRQIDWAKMFELAEDESVECYTKGTLYSTPIIVTNQQYPILQYNFLHAHLRQYLTLSPS